MPKKAKKKQHLLLRRGSHQGKTGSKITDLERSLLFSPESPQTVSNPATTSSNVAPDKSDAIVAYLRWLEEYFYTTGPLITVLCN